MTVDNAKKEKEILSVYDQRNKFQNYKIHCGFAELHIRRFSAGKRVHKMGISHLRFGYIQVLLRGKVLKACFGIFARTMYIAVILATDI